jgi:hypothetical protein
VAAEVAETMNLDPRALHAALAAALKHEKASLK